MQAILPQIATHNVSEACRSLEQNFANLSNITDAIERRLYATLKFIQQSLPDELTRLLIPLALHERFVDTVYLKAMAGRANKCVTREHIERFTATLVRAGLLTGVGVSIYRDPSAAAELSAHRSSAGCCSFSCREMEAGIYRGDGRSR